MSTPSLAAGGIMKFAKVKLACLGCKATLSAGETTLCSHCKSKVYTSGITNNRVAKMHEYPRSSQICKTGA